MKVYCNNCKYKHLEHSCKHPNSTTLIENYDGLKKKYESRSHLNNNNNCLRFEKASIFTKLIRKLTSLFKK